jgi:CDP-glucose 4,6-dehydratase
MYIDKSFWFKKRVFITGHTGFKGAWLALWLQSLGADVTGFALPPIGSPNLFDAAQVAKNMKSYYYNILDSERLYTILHESQPEFIFHLAAQALVLEGYNNAANTFETNVMGTVNVLECSRKLESKPTVVCITTDKVYHNNEWVYSYREIDPLGGLDPYSASKSASEMVISSYRDSFLKAAGIRVCVARAGNVIGGGDWAANRLIPDAIRAWNTGVGLELRNPDATRPWQHVLDPLAGYLLLAQKYSYGAINSSVFNFGPDSCEAVSVRKLITAAREEYGKGTIIFDDMESRQHEARQLNLDISKAKVELGFEPKLSLKESICRTMKWYLEFTSGHDARRLCLDDITYFMK